MLCSATIERKVTFILIVDVNMHQDEISFYSSHRIDISVAHLQNKFSSSSGPGQFYRKWGYL
jgi:hypothetical protein